VEAWRAATTVTIARTTTVKRIMDPIFPDTNVLVVVAMKMRSYIYIYINLDVTLF
jgi:hypothetical protein